MPEQFLFVCHVREDRAAALEIVEELERRGLRCWIAPRDVRPGRPFDDEIANAIETCQALLLIFSSRCNESEYIRREVTVAGESRKVIIPFRIEDAEPKRGLRVRLSDLHWLDGFISREHAVEELIRIFPAAQDEAVATAAAERAPRESTAPVIEEAREGADTEPRRRAALAERQKEGEQRVRRKAQAQRRAEDEERFRRPEARPRWPLSRLALGVVACLIVAAIATLAYPTILAYIKPKETTRVAVQPAPPPAPAPPPVVATPPQSTSGLSVLSAIYGDNCPFNPDDKGQVDVTSFFVEFCKKEPAGLCRYPIEPRVLGDPSKGCAKSLRVRYACATEKITVVKEAIVPPEAAGNYALLQCAGAAGAIRSTLEEGVDRSGADYRNFQLPSPEARLCQEACLDDARCLAWTFVRPGYQGPSSACWLKSKVPAAANRPCCVSGIIR